MASLVVPLIPLLMGIATVLGDSPLSHQFGQAFGRLMQGLCKKNFGTALSTIPRTTPFSERKQV